MSTLVAIGDSLTRDGKKQLQREAGDWNRMAALMARLLGKA